MNKGRNLALLMAALLTLSLLTFLTRARNKNYSAVVDNVRYIRESSDDTGAAYEFYFVEKTVMEGTLAISETGDRKLTIRIRVPIEKEEDEEEDEDALNYYTVPYGYSYIISGTSLKDAKVSWEYAEGFDETNVTEKPFERFTKKVFKTMVFGSTPLVTVPQAIMVAAIGVGGALIIGYAEELWHFVKKKGEDEDPKWEELTVYKRIGGGIIGFAAALLILFVII